MIKKILFTSFVLGLFFLNTLAQSPTFEWAKSIGAINYDYGYGITHDASGNVYTTGSFQGTVDFDPGPGVFNLTSSLKGIFVSKLDNSGNFVWAKAMSGNKSGRGNEIVLDTFGNIYITGIFTGTIDFDPGVGVFNLTSVGQNNDVFICKLDALGDFVWAKQISGTEHKSAVSIALDKTGDGDIYISGEFIETVDFDPGAGIYNLTSVGDKTDIFICKLDSSGNFIWAKQLGGLDLKRSGQLIVDSEGNGDIYIIGTFQGTVDFDPDLTTNFYLTPIANYDIFITKLSSSGNFIWAKQLGGTAFNEGFSIAIDPSGNRDILVTGSFQGSVDFDPGVGIFNLYSAGDFDIFISKLSSSGNFIWAKAMGGSSYQKGFYIALDLVGNVYTTGYFRGNCDFNPDPSETFFLNAPGNDEVFISKLDNSGNFVWAKQIVGNGDDYGLALTANPSGELFLTGAFFSPFINFDTTTLTNHFSGGYTCDVFIAKLKSDTAGMDDLEQTRKFIVYPNPVTDNLSFTFSSNTQNVEVILTDITGKIIKSFKLKSTTINVSDLSNGTYFIKLKGENNTISQKFIKQ